MAEKIRYEVDVDSSDAVSGLRDFSRAAQKAGKDAAKGLDETATAGDKARTAIKQMATVMDSELRGAAQAAEALSKALGPELAGRMDVNQVVLDLQKMGVTFDEIRLEADAYATTLRQIDGIRLQQVNDGLGTMRTKMDSVRSSSDQSRSVLANLAGNAAQDLGALSGVVGSLGVGIGQLAEYAVDGNIASATSPRSPGRWSGWLWRPASSPSTSKASKSRRHSGPTVDQFTEAIARSAPSSAVRRWRNRLNWSSPSSVNRILGFGQSVAPDARRRPHRPSPSQDGEGDLTDSRADRRPHGDAISRSQTSSILTGSEAEQDAVPRHRA